MQSGLFCFCARGRDPAGRRRERLRRAQRDSTRSPATRGAGEAPKQLETKITETRMRNTSLFSRCEDMSEYVNAQHLVKYLEKPSKLI